MVLMTASITSASAAATGLLPLAAMLVALVAVGWGLGLAAALARCSVDSVDVRGDRHLCVSSPTGACLAVIVATFALSGYLVVLHTLGYLAY